MHERLDRTRRRPRLEGRAGLAQLDSPALGLAETEALADERVQVDAPREDVASRGGRVDLQPVLGERMLELLRLSISKQTVLVIEVAVAFEPLPGNGRYRLDPMRQVAAVRGDEDRLDSPMTHGPHLTMGT